MNNIKFFIAANAYSCDNVIFLMLNQNDECMNDVYCIRISSLTSFSIGQLIFLFSLYSSIGHIEKYNISFI
jgi:hypothetical protein